MTRVKRRTQPKATGLLLAALLLTGCGFQLRGSHAQQAPLPAVRVVSEDSYSLMARTLRQVWQKQSGDQPSDALYVVQILEEDIDRRPVTYTASGTPAQYEMTLEVTYALQRAGEAEPGLPRTLSTHRLFDFDPRNVVAKAEEERALLDQMREQIAQRLLSLISRRAADSEANGDAAPAEQGGAVTP